MNSKSNSILETSKKLELYIQQDPGNRGLANWAIQGSLFPASMSLSGGNHIIISTGFYILDSGVIETDGPPGTIVLAKALMSIGKEVTIVTDKHAEDIMKVGMKVINCNAELVCIGEDNIKDMDSVIKDNTTHFVALERPGQAKNGLHHNFRGKVISEFVAPTDELFIKCAKLGIVTVAIGDGGNELGMGNVSAKIEEHQNPKRDFCCFIKSDYCICAGVSNWAGYAVSGILSVLNKSNLLPSFDLFRAILQQIVNAGAVDGVSGKNEPTVDGLEISWEDSIYNSVLEIGKGY